MRHRKDTILDLQMSGEPVYALGAHFTYDLEVSEKKIEYTLNMWSQRDLSIVGKINISTFKTCFYLQRHEPKGLL